MITDEGLGTDVSRDGASNGIENVENESKPSLSLSKRAEALGCGSELEMSLSLPLLP